MNDIEYSDEGYIYVASKNKLFYELSLFSAESLRTFHPKAHVTLFTHEAFVDDRAKKLFDNVITGIPVHARAKMWCMARTPYQKTFYNDVDSQIVHRRIREVFDYIEDCDLFFTESYWYTTGSHRWAWFDKQQKIPVDYHGAVCCYNKNDLVIDFMQTWFDEYVKQRHSKGWPYDFAYKEWKQFDMFTLWRISSGRFEEFERFKQLNVKLGPKMFNATIHDGKKLYDGKKPVIYQIDKDNIQNAMPDLMRTIEKGLKDERTLPKKPENHKDLIWYN